MKAYNLANKVKKVKYLILDVDGVLTQGGLFYNEGDQETKRFDVKDGLAVFIALKSGLGVGIISGKRSEALQRRATELGVQDLEQGVNDKREAYKSIKEKYGYNDEEMAFLGDDIIDLSVLVQVGFSACTGDAHFKVKEAVDYITVHKGGLGAVRELIDLILFLKQIDLGKVALPFFIPDLKKKP
ncbi:HAD-IIIA family hydrolase [bacterium]|nr:HAD-IIIA family hydrolase [bacterium]